MSFFTDEKLKAYLHSRVIYSGSTNGEVFGIIVDGFRFLRAHQRYFLSQNVALTSSLNQEVKKEECSTVPRKPCVSSERSAQPRIFYFLSHFHSDHYTGLTSSWNNARIFCSVSTAAAVVHSLGISPKYVCPLEVGKIYQGQIVSSTSSSSFPFFPELVLMEEPNGGRREVFSSADNTKSCKNPYSMDWCTPTPSYFSVRLLCANHCPGAVMFLFYSPSFGYVVHTGDFRFETNGWRNPPAPLLLQKPPPITVKVQPPEKEALSSRALGEGNQNVLLGHAKDPEKSNWVTKELFVHSFTLRKVSSKEAPRLMAYEDTLIMDDPYLRAACGKVRTLFLDNTYGAPCFEFPPQRDAAREVVEEVGALLWDEVLRSVQKMGLSSTFPKATKSSPNCSLTFQIAILSGSYTLGKERLVLDLLETFSELSGTGLLESDSESKAIWASPEKVALLRAMQVYNKHFRSWKLLSPKQEFSTLLSGVDINNVSSDAVCMKGFEEADDMLPHNDEKTRRKIIATIPSVHLPVFRLLEHCENVREKMHEFSSSASASFVSSEVVNEVCQSSSLSVTLFILPMEATGYVAIRKALTCRSSFLSEVSLSTVPPSSEEDKNSGDCFLSVSAYPSIPSFTHRSPLSLLKIQENIFLDLATFHHVIAVEPTGWTKKKKRSVIYSKRNSTVFSTQNSSSWSTPYSAVRISFPYSEHSSFSKLLEFVRFLNPQRIIPTVDAELFKKHESLFLEKAPRLLSSFGVMPLSRLLAAGSSREKTAAASGTASTVIRPTTPLSTPPSATSTSTIGRAVGPSNSAPTGRFVENTEDILHNSITEGVHGTSEPQCVAEGKASETENSVAHRKMQKPSDAFSRRLDSFVTPTVAKLSQVPLRWEMDETDAQTLLLLPSKTNMKTKGRKRKRFVSPEASIIESMEILRQEPANHLMMSSKRFSLSKSPSNQSCVSDCVFLRKEEVVFVISSDDDEHRKHEEV